METNRAYCRNCGGLLRFVSQFELPARWVHIEERSGLLRGEFCYYSPRADPILP